MMLVVLARVALLPLGSLGGPLDEGAGARVVQIPMKALLPHSVTVPPVSLKEFEAEIGPGAFPSSYLPSVPVQRRLVLTWLQEQGATHARNLCPPGFSLTRCRQQWLARI